VSVGVEVRRGVARLPVAPLVEAVEGERAVRGIGVRRLLPPTRLRAYRLAKVEGSLTPYQVKRLCAAIDRCPREVYGDAYNEAVASVELEEVAAPPPVPSLDEGAGSAAFQWLPASPLVEVIEARIQRHVDGCVLAPDMARGEAMATLFGADGALKQAFSRARERDLMTLEAAEQLCDGLGWHPRMIWADAYDAVVFEGMPADFDPWVEVAA
jgi:hypothetical protein